MKHDVFGYGFVTAKSREDFESRNLAKFKVNDFWVSI